MAKKKLECRKPNLLELYGVLDLVNQAPPENGFQRKIALIKAVEPFVNHKELGYESYEKLLEDTQGRGAELAALADKFYSDIAEVFAKKS